MERRAKFGTLDRLRGKERDSNIGIERVLDSVRRPRVYQGRDVRVVMRVTSGEA